MTNKTNQLKQEASRTPSLSFAFFIFFFLNKNVLLAPGFTVFVLQILVGSSLSSVLRWDEQRLHKR